MGVSGANITFDSSRDTGTRIVKVKMWKTGEELDVEKIYTTTVIYFAAVGKDGYSCF
jgi:2',3'-cyclic-nucleotide 2'-phosphodiesterase (5'-nucleotidase family)